MVLCYKQPKSCPVFCNIQTVQNLTGSFLGDLQNVWLAQKPSRAPVLFRYVESQSSLDKLLSFSLLKIPFPVQHATRCFPFIPVQLRLCHLIFARDLY